MRPHLTMVDEGDSPCDDRAPGDARQAEWDSCRGKPSECVNDHAHRDLAEHDGRQRERDAQRRHGIGDDEDDEDAVQAAKPLPGWGLVEQRKVALVHEQHERTEDEGPAGKRHERRLCVAHDFGEFGVGRALEGHGKASARDQRNEQRVQGFPSYPSSSSKLRIASVACSQSCS